jgi:hypothetical protein
MKKLMLTLVCLAIVLLSTNVNAQDTKKSDSFKPGWYLGANGGVSWFLGEGSNFILDPNSNFSLIDNAGLLGRLSAGYDFTPVVGVKAMLGYTANRYPNHLIGDAIQQ